MQRGFLTTCLNVGDGGTQYSNHIGKLLLCHVRFSALLLYISANQVVEQGFINLHILEVCTMRQHMSIVKTVKITNVVIVIDFWQQLRYITPDQKKSPPIGWA